MIRLTRSQIREVDRRSIEQYHIPGIVLMENAARAVVGCAWDMLAKRPAPVIVVCGGGNNGGDGLAVARHLHNRGCAVKIELAVDPLSYTGDALVNWRITEAMGIPLGWHLKPALIIDALFGTGLTKPPRDESAAVIDKINASGARCPILAIDLPSGLDCDTGLPLSSHCVKAAHTVTFVTEKAGFANPDSRIYTGEVTIGDIGCPRTLIEDIAADRS